MRLMLALAAFALLQDPPRDEGVIAIVGAKIMTVTKGDIASGTIVIKDGKIAEIGPDVKPPAGATVIDGKGLVAFPGLVHPYSRLTVRGGGEGGGASNATVLAYDSFSPAADILEAVPRSGYTTLVLYPSAGTVAGQAVAIKPIGLSRDEMLLAKTAYLRIDMETSTAAKDQLRRDYEAAKKAHEATKKPAQPPPPQPQPPPQPPAPVPAPAPAPAPAAAQKPDEKMEVWLRHLKGELPAVVDIASPAEFAHFRQVMKPFDDLKAPMSYVMTSEAYKAADKIGELKPRVMMGPDITFLPFTRTRVNAPAELAKAGATVGLMPGDSLRAQEGFLFQVAELVRLGFDRDAALRAITIVPAEVAGLDRRIGSLEAGKDADVVLFDGDPLAATTRITKVLINGKVAWQR